MWLCQLPLYISKNKAQYLSVDVLTAITLRPLPATNSVRGKNAHTNLVLHDRHFSSRSTLPSVLLCSSRTLSPTHYSNSITPLKCSEEKLLSNSSIRRGGCERKEVKGGSEGREEILANIPTLCKSRFDTQAQKHWRWLEIWRRLNLTFPSSDHVYAEHRGHTVCSKNKQTYTHILMWSMCMSQCLPLTMKQRPTKRNNS